MQVDAGLSASVVRLRQERVMLTLRDEAGHAASVDMPAQDAIHLAHVLAGDLHGSCPDTWLVERMPGAGALWLTLSSTRRGLVRVSRIEMDDDMADHVAARLLDVAAECAPAPRSTPSWRRAFGRTLHTLARWITAMPTTRHPPPTASLHCDR